MLLLRLLVDDQRHSGGRRRDGLATLDQGDDLVSLATQVAVGAERVVPAALRAVI